MLQRSLLRTVALVLLLLAAGPCAAGPDHAGTEPGWVFRIKPVIWNPDISLRFSDSDEEDEDIIEPGYCFFCFDKLSGYLALQAEAGRERFSLLFETLQVSFEDRPLDAPVGLNIASTLGFHELLAAYRHIDHVPLDAYAGLRYTFVDNVIRLDGLPDAEAEYDWLDPVIGARYTYSIDTDWSVLMRGDLGGFGVDTDLMINISVDAVYRISELVSVSAGYRYLDIDFEDDDLLYHVNLQGMQLALAFDF